MSISLVPGLSLSTSQAWLNQTAVITPEPSATVASTIRRLRLLVGRQRAERTSATIVAGLPIGSSAMAMASARSG